MDFPLLRFALTYPGLELRLAIIIFVLLLCFSAFWIFQKILPHLLFGEDSEYAGYIYNAMGVVFSLVFAFVTVLVWQNYNGVSDAVAKEASTLNNVYRVFSAFKPEVDKTGKSQVRAYVNTVITEEWPLLSKGEFSINAYKEMTALEDFVIHIKPQNMGESNAHQQLLHLTLQATELRRSRIYNAKFALASPAWAGLIMSLLIFLIFSCLFRMKSQKIHLILILFLSLTVVGILYFLILFIHPFLGPLAITSNPFTGLLNTSWLYQ
jgi:hypothetical protein